jgi:hypothetical protein
VEALAPAPAAALRLRFQGSGLACRGRCGARRHADPRRGQGRAGDAAVGGLQRVVHRRDRRRRARGLWARAGHHGHPPLWLRHLGVHPGLLLLKLHRH